MFWLVVHLALLDLYVCTQQFKVQMNPVYLLFINDAIKKNVEYYISLHISSMHERSDLQPCL